MSDWTGLDGLMTEAEVAEILKATNARAVARLRRQGLIVGVRVGHSYRYHPADVDAYVNRLRDEARSA